MIKLLPGENVVYPLVSVFDRGIKFMYIQVGTRAFQLQLYPRLPTQLVNKNCSLDLNSYFFFTRITDVKQISKIQCKYLLIFFLYICIGD